MGADLVGGQRRGVDRHLIDRACEVLGVAVDRTDRDVVVPQVERARQRRRALQDAIHVERHRGPVRGGHHVVPRVVLIAGHGDRALGRAVDHRLHHGSVLGQPEAETVVGVADDVALAGRPRGAEPGLERDGRSGQTPRRLVKRHLELAAAAIERHRGRGPVIDRRGGTECDPAARGHGMGADGISGAGAGRLVKAPMADRQRFARDDGWIHRGCRGPDRDHATDRVIRRDRDQGQVLCRVARRQDRLDRPAVAVVDGLARDVGVGPGHIPDHDVINAEGDRSGGGSADGQVDVRRPIARWRPCPVKDLPSAAGGGRRDGGVVAPACIDPEESLDRESGGRLHPGAHAVRVPLLERGPREVEPGATPAAGPGGDRQALGACLGVHRSRAQRGRIAREPAGRRAGPSVDPTLEGGEPHAGRAAGIVVGKGLRRSPGGVIQRLGPDKVVVERSRRGDRTRAVDPAAGAVDRLRKRSIRPGDHGDPLESVSSGRGRPPGRIGGARDLARDVIDRRSHEVGVGIGGRGHIVRVVGGRAHRTIVEVVEGPSHVAVHVDRLAWASGGIEGRHAVAADARNARTGGRRCLTGQGRAARAGRMSGGIEVGRRRAIGPRARVHGHGHDIAQQVVRRVGACRDGAGVASVGRRVEDVALGVIGRGRGDVIDPAAVVVGRPAAVEVGDRGDGLPVVVEDSLGLGPIGRRDEHRVVEQVVVHAGALTHRRGGREAVADRVIGERRGGIRAELRARDVGGVGRVGRRRGLVVGIARAHDPAPRVSLGGARGILVGTRTLRPIEEVGDGPRSQ